MEEMITNNNLYAKLNVVRVELSKSLEKSGKNNYSKYDYFQLKDFMPKAIELCNEQGLFTKFWMDKEKIELPSKKTTQHIFDDNGERKSEIVNEEDNFQYVEYAYVLVVDVESGAEELFKKETREVTLQASQPIQNLGGKNTYMKRYMYMDVFEINENDSVEEETGAPVTVETKVETKTKSRKKPAVQEVSTKPAENVTPYDFMPQTTMQVAPQEVPVAAPVVSAPVEVAPQNTEDLMSMETKISLAETIKNAGLDPRTAIIEFAQELGTDVPFLKESDKDKIVEMINKKVGK
jgi:hypothetical protein